MPVIKTIYWPPVGTPRMLIVCAQGEGPQPQHFLTQCISQFRIPTPEGRTAPSGKLAQAREGRSAKSSPQYNRCPRDRRSAREAIRRNRMADTKPGPKAVLEFVKEHNVQILDLRFTDLPGLWHHVSYPIAQLSESSFEEGFGMDGSSIRGWAAIHESDMLLIPDASKYILDPFTEVPTMVMVCDVIDPVTKQRYDRDPRYIAKKAEMYLASTGLADTAYFGAEAEFFIFDNVRFDQNEHEGYYFVDAEEGRWNSGRVENNLGYRPRYKEGYFPVPPTDHYQDLRTEMALP